MVAFLKKLFNMLNADLTGRSWHKEVAHPYFNQLIYFGHKDPSKCYWEAELEIPGEEYIGVTMEGTPEGPTSAEEEFCRATIKELDNLLERCHTAFESEYISWTKKSLPSEWKSEFKLDGFSVPLNGNINEKWEVTYFVESTGHYFIAIFDHDDVKEVQVDG